MRSQLGTRSKTRPMVRVRSAMLPCLVSQTDAHVSVKELHPRTLPVSLWRNPLHMMTGLVLGSLEFWRYAGKHASALATKRMDARWPAFHTITPKATSHGLAQGGSPGILSLPLDLSPGDGGAQCCMSQWHFPSSSNTSRVK